MLKIHEKRIVVKIGSSTLTHETGRLNIRKTEELIKTLSDLKNAGYELIIVTSGAVAIGVGKLSLHEKPTELSGKQACAAIGQCELMHIYDTMFSEYNHTVAQLLLTRDIVEDDLRLKRVVDTMERLLEMGVIPIINENDTVSTEELEFGDNDTLSAICAKIFGAYRLIILSDIDGLYERNPKKDPNAKLISKVQGLDDHIRSIAEGAGSNRGTGGMITKIHAAEIMASAGGIMHIINGNDHKNLYRVLDGKEVGTTFLP